nr:MAG TPA: hypothetical protein [Caudoviricetes sp.]
MKKDHIRDYATEAFRFYASKKKEMSITGDLAADQDISAVIATMNELKREEDFTTFAVVEKVYFSDPDKKLKRGDISARVIKATMLGNISERQAYASLEKARKIFAKKRGLRMESLQ